MSSGVSRKRLLHLKCDICVTTVLFVRVWRYVLCLLVQLFCGRFCVEHCIGNLTVSTIEPNIVLKVTGYLSLLYCVHISLNLVCSGLHVYAHMHLIKYLHDIVACFAQCPLCFCDGLYQTMRDQCHRYCQSHCS